MCAWEFEMLLGRVGSDADMCDGMDGVGEIVNAGKRWTGVGGMRWVEFGYRLR